MTPWVPIPLAPYNSVLVERGHLPETKPIDSLMGTSKCKNVRQGENIFHRHMCYLPGNIRDTEKKHFARI